MSTFYPVGVPGYMFADKDFDHDHECNDGQFAFERQMKFIKDQLETSIKYDKLPVFIALHNQANHGPHQSATLINDGWLQQLIEYVIEQTNNTVLYIFSDHGSYWGSSQVEILESNNPFSLLFLPLQTFSQFSCMSFIRLCLFTIYLGINNNYPIYEQTKTR